MISFKGRHFPKDIILMAVRWKVSYPFSYRNIEELLEERGAEVDHSTIQKWLFTMLQSWKIPLEKENPVGKSWKMIERLGIQKIRMIPGYHDELLKGERQGQRSIRLNRAYRAIYIVLVFQNSICVIWSTTEK